MIRETKPQINDFMVKRIGFKPDNLVQVVGTSHDNRQELLKKAQNFCGPDDSPPCTLVREKDNQYDLGAVAVHLGVDYDTHTGWDMKRVGYLPKDYQIGDSAPVHTLIDQHIGEVLIGVDGIYSQGGLFGLRVGLRFLDVVKKQLYLAKSRDFSFIKGEIYLYLGKRGKKHIFYGRLRGFIGDNFVGDDHKGRINLNEIPGSLELLSGEKMAALLMLLDKDFERVWDEFHGE